MICKSSLLIGVLVASALTFSTFGCQPKDEEPAANSGYYDGEMKGKGAPGGGGEDPTQAAPPSTTPQSGSNSSGAE